MKPRRPVSMIILDAILIVWWIIFIAMFFAALIMTEAYKPDELRGFRGEGMVVIFDFLISEGEGWLRSEWKVGRFWTSILLLFSTVFTIWLTHQYFNYFNYIDQFRWPCVKLSILTYFICLYINVSPSINEYLKNYKWQHWLEPWRNCYSYYKDGSDDQN